MPVLVNSKFEKDPIKNKRASLKTPFSHYKSMGIFFKRSWAPDFSEESGPISPKFELVRDCMCALVTCKFDEDQIKTEGISVETSSPYKSMAAFCCHGSHSFDGIYSKTWKQPPLPASPPLPCHWWYIWNLIKIGQLILEIP